MENSYPIPVFVSIVLCTHNGEKYLRQQLDSILAQTHTHFELIVSDDASKDDTAKILEEYCQRDQRIKFSVNPVNLGYNKNFEKAFSLASAEYIAISDQDDVWEKNKIETILKGWPPGSIFVYSLSGNFYGDDFSSRKPAPNVKYEPITHLYQLVFSSPVHGHACMFKKGLLSNCTPFPATIYYDWWMSMHAVAISSLGCIPQTLTWHRVHGDNSSRTILSVTDKEERNLQLRAQFIYSLETFHRVAVVIKGEDKFLLRYVELLKKMDGKSFSAALFFCILRNRKKIFHYKKDKPFLFFSHLKHSLRMARTGVL